MILNMKTYLCRRLRIRIVRGKSIVISGIGIVEWDAKPIPVMIADAYPRHWEALVGGAFPIEEGASFF